MHLTFFATAAFLTAFTAAAVIPRDLSQQTISNAGGAVPNSAFPDKISDAAVAAFQAVNYLENLESAFFASGLQNLTGPWYDESLGLAIEIVTKVQAQELVHVQTAQDLLTHFHKPTLPPCKYVFPATSPDDFFALATTITTIGLGALIDLAASLALTDPALVQTPTSILAVEARHDAFFRAAAALSPIPNPAPFDTRLSGPYALNLALPFIVPNSCPATPPFPPIPPLTQLPNDASTTDPNTSSITFSLDPTKIPHTSPNASLFIGWLNQADNVRYTAAIVRNGVVNTTVPDGMAGVAFAALTNQSSGLGVAELTAHTLAGPVPVVIS